MFFLSCRNKAVLPPELKAKRGGRIEKTTTSKGLMHSNEHIKENWAPDRGGSTPLPPLGESLNKPSSGVYLRLYSLYTVPQTVCPLYTVVHVYWSIHCLALSIHWKQT